MGGLGPPPARVCHGFVMRPLRLHWSSSKPNFGDWLSPVICGILSGRTVVHAGVGRCDLVAVGSLLSRIKEGWFQRPVHVWGTGFIEERPVKSSKHFYHAVRGHKSAAQLRSPTVPALGDPGLLCDLVLPEHARLGKDYAVGLVPHYTDQDHPWVRRFVERHPHTTILNVFSEVRDFLRQLARCEFVISSSLHGLIAADSFSIPNARIRLSRRIRGDDFKFDDYYSVYGIDRPEVIPTETELTRGRIEELLAEK